MKWYEKYTGFSYQHLGLDPKTGIDCFNLIKLIYEKELNIEIPYDTRDWCNIIDTNWYNYDTTRAMDKAATEKFGWKKIEKPEIYDVVTMSIGSTNQTNHCALYVDRSRLLHCMDGKKSWIGVYGKYYKQYTIGIYRWIGINNDTIPKIT
jgi:cell wall-associated NlpC family hydrolase